MNTARTFFSVVIPLYNKEAHIANTLLSVLNQQFQDFEVLVIDDGSTDESARIARTFANSQIRVYSQPNGGVSAARNAGIALAKSQYIAFLDADDLWEPDYLAEMKRLIGRFQGCGFYGAAHTVLDNNRRYVEGTVMAEGIVEDYFQNEFRHHITRLSATIVSRQVFETVKGFPVGMISGEDNYFCACVAIHYPVAFTPKPLVIYNKKYSGMLLRFDKTDMCQERWSDLYAEGDFYRNELIATKALKAGIRYALGYHRAKSFKMENDFRFTQLSKKKWYYLYLLNRLPDTGIKLVTKLIFLKKLLTYYYIGASNPARPVKPALAPKSENTPPNKELAIS